MKRIAVVFECIKFDMRPRPSYVKAAPPEHKIVVVEVNLTDEEFSAVEGPLLEQAEGRIWTRLYAVAGTPPPGYSSWLASSRWHRIA